jgi:hypothetical protein
MNCLAARIEDLAERDELGVGSATACSISPTTLRSSPMPTSWHAEALSRVVRLAILKIDCIVSL